ncbi:MAG: hypothetical protein Q9196_005522, partial [Gyalolechia fulgens]
MAQAYSTHQTSSSGSSLPGGPVPPGFNPDSGSTAPSRLQDVDAMRGPLPAMDDDSRKGKKRQLSTTTQPPVFTFASWRIKRQNMDEAEKRAAESSTRETQLSSTKPTDTSTTRWKKKMPRNPPAGLGFGNQGTKTRLGGESSGPQKQADKSKMDVMVEKGLETMKCVAAANTIRQFGQLSREQRVLGDWALIYPRLPSNDKSDRIPDLGSTITVEWYQGSTTGGGARVSPQKYTGVVVRRDPAELEAPRTDFCVCLHMPRSNELGSNNRVRKAYISVEHNLTTVEYELEAVKKMMTSRRRPHVSFFERVALEAPPPSSVSVNLSEGPNAFMIDVVNGACRIEYGGTSLLNYANVDAVDEAYQKYVAGDGTAKAGDAEDYDDVDDPELDSGWRHGETYAKMTAFVRDFHRICVGLTRAMDGLIV